MTLAVRPSPNSTLPTTSPMIHANKVKATPTKLFRNTNAQYSRRRALPLNVAYFFSTRKYHFIVLPSPFFPCCSRITSAHSPAAAHPATRKVWLVALSLKHVYAELLVD